MQRQKRSVTDNTACQTESKEDRGLTENQTPVSEKELARDERRSWLFSDDWREISKHNNTYKKQIHRTEQKFKF